MPYALIAPITSVPSRPRLMRPERSVMHSPRLTNRNGVETRMAPPSTASGTVQSPIEPSAISGLSLQKPDAAVERIAGQDEDEDDALQHQHGCIRQSEAALQQPAAGADTTEQNRDGDNGERILPRQEGDENPCEAVARGEVGVGAPLHGGDLDHAGKARGAAGEEADGQDQLADIEADDLRSADVAAGNTRGEAEHGVIDQDIGGDRGDQAEHETPMHVGAGDRSDQVGRADLAG